VIRPAQVEYELEMPDRAAVRLHLGCHGLWVAERARQGLDRPPGQPAEQCGEAAP
jgi:hypothetical protein